MAIATSSFLLFNIPIKIVVAKAKVSETSGDKNTPSTPKNLGNINDTGTKNIKERPIEIIFAYKSFCID